MKFIVDAQVKVIILALSARNACYASVCCKYASRSCLRRRAARPPQPHVF